MKVIAQIKKWSVITMIIGLIGGVLFIAFPEPCIKYISLAVGASFIVIGVFGIINYLLDKSSAFSLVMGVILALTGVVICIKYKTIISVILIIIGVFVLITGIINFFTAIKVIVSSVFFGWFTLALSLTTIAFGIIAITKSNDMSNAIVQLVGASLIVYSILDLVAFIQVRQLVKQTAVDIDNVINQGEEVESSGEIIEETEEEA